MNPNRVEDLWRTGCSHRLLAIVTDDPLGPESLRELRPGGPHDQGNGVDLRVVVPAVEANAFRHTLGDIDEPREEAEARLGRWSKSSARTASRLLGRWAIPTRSKLPRMLC